MAEAKLEGNVAHQLLSHAHPSDVATDVFQRKVQHKPLLLKPTAGEDDRAVNARARRQRARAEKEAQRRKSRKPGPLSAKQKRSLRVHDIPKAERKYELYVPLWRMWVSYIREILNVDHGYVDAKSAGPLLASADYHGALLEVVRSRCVGRVGSRGIVLKDTKFTFELITEKNELKS